MLQHHYLVHAIRMEELRAEAERERRWRLEDEANGRPLRAPSPGRARAATARAVAAMSRGAATVARRLDERVTLDRAGERLLRDA